jgi:hypothetical protein
MEAPYGFLPSKEQRQIATAAREFARREFPERALEFDRTESFDLALWKKASALGFVGGFIDAHEIQRLYRDAKILEIYEGSKEIEKRIVARSLLRQGRRTGALPRPRGLHFPLFPPNHPRRSIHFRISIKGNIVATVTRTAVQSGALRGRVLKAACRNGT